MPKKKNDKTTHPNIRSAEGKAVVLYLREQGFPNHRIAPLFDENQGRVTDIFKKKKRRK